MLCIDHTNRAIYICNPCLYNNVTLTKFRSNDRKTKSLIGRITFRMNAKNLNHVSSTLEEAVGKVATILRFENEGTFKTVLCPMITLKALFNQIDETVAQLPPMHRTQYQDDLQYISQKFMAWINEWPDVLQLETIRQNKEFKSMTKR